MRLSRRKVLAIGGLGAAAAALDPLGLLPGGVTRALAAAPKRLTTEETITTFETGGYHTIVTGPPEPWMIRHELYAGAPQSSQRPLLAFAQMSDMQIVDHQSPLRVEFLDSYHDGTGVISGTGSAYRPHEMLSAQMTDAMCRAIRLISRGPRTALPLALCLVTGDMTDNCQYNETRWYMDLLDGAMVRADSGDLDRDESHSSRALIDAGDTGASTRYWRPEEGPQTGAPTRLFPRIPGLLAASHRTFQATGLGIPWYPAYGNHDGLVQGNMHIRFGDVFNERHLLLNIATGSHKPISIDIEEDDGTFEVFLELLLGIAGDIGSVNVSRDANRKLLERELFVQEHFNTTGQPAGHGFSYDNLDEAYYAIPSGPDDLFQFICLDSVNTASWFGDAGSIDEPQFNWLEQLLIANSTRYLVWNANFRRFEVANNPSGKDKLMVLFCHHTLDTMTNTDNSRDDSSARFNGNTLKFLLLRFPNVIMLVNGHSHANNIWAHTRGTLLIPGGFWEINTASHIDWPIQGRIIEVAESKDVLSIYTTLVDMDAPLSYGEDLSTAANLASLGRELAANDPQTIAKGLNARSGTLESRNTQLLLPAPFPIGAKVTSTSATRLADGRIVVFVVDEKRRAWYQIQVTAGTDTWSNWQLLSTALITITALTASNGIHVFGVDDAGRAWYRLATNISSNGWTAWEMIATGGMSTALSAFTAVVNGAGALGVFGIDEAGRRVFTRVQYAQPSGGNPAVWSPWNDFTGGTPMTRITAQTDGFGRVHLFGISPAAQPLHRWELAPNTGQFSGWVSFMHNLPINFRLATIDARIVGTNGALVVFATTGPGQIIARTQYAASPDGGTGGTWSPWSSIDGSLATVAVSSTSDNRIWLFGSDSNGKPYQRWETQAGTGSWSGWVSMNRPAPATTAFPPPPPHTRTPDLRGMTLPQATSALSAANHTLGRVQDQIVFESIDNDKVVWQSRRPGYLAPNGISVDIALGDYRGGNR